MSNLYYNHFLITSFLKLYFNSLFPKIGPYFCWLSTSTIIKIFSRVNVLGKKLHLGGCATFSAKSEVILINKTFLTWNRINDYHNGQSTISNNERHVDKRESLIKIVINCRSSWTPSFRYIWFVKLHNQWCRKVKNIGGATSKG